MILGSPMPFHEALDAAEVRSLLPTTGRHADLQQMPRRIKQHALWSATVDMASRLQAIADGVNGVLTGQMDQTSVRVGLMELLQRQGYRPAPDKAGGMQDLSSLPRLNLIIDTQTQLAQGYGWDVQGMQEDVLDEFPARELYDTAPGGKGRRNWGERWAQVGGVFHDGRMIALATDPIWARLGDPANFPDALGNEFAPFALNSAWRQRDIGRDEAVELGLIGPDDQVFPRQTDLTEELKATPDVRDADLRAALEETGLGTFDAKGVFNFQQEANA